MCWSKWEPPHFYHGMLGGLQRVFAENSTSQAQFGNLPQPNQCVSPVLSTSRAGAFRNGLKNREVARLPLKSWVKVPTGHAKKPPPLPQFSEGDKMNFTVPPNQLLSPVLSTSRSGEFRNGLKSKKHICLPTQILH